MQESPLTWLCPTCNVGHLTIGDDKFSVSETASSKALIQHEAWEVEWVELRFAGLMICANKACQECVAFSGTGTVNQAYEYDDDGYMIQDHYNLFKPLYFNPPLNLFTLTDKYPSSIKNEIIVAFGLYWNNSAACANKIRMILEMIMDDLKIQKSTLNRGKRNKMPLHMRLQKFENKNQEVAKHLLAIKWIGNTGSHIGKIEKVDLIDAFELLEYSLTKIYDTSEKRLTKMADKINKVKGVLSSKSKKNL